MFINKKTVFLFVHSLNSQLALHYEHPFSSCHLCVRDKDDILYYMYSKWRLCQLMYVMPTFSEHA